MKRVQDLPENARVAEGDSTTKGEASGSAIAAGKVMHPAVEHSHETMAQGARRFLRERCDELEAKQDPDVSVVEEIHELKKALDRLDRGTWGRCETCDGAIGRDRLRAIPETRTCLDCAR
jgi:DnaK suppressor protein